MQSFNEPRKSRSVGCFVLVGIAALVTLPVVGWFVWMALSFMPPSIPVVGAIVLVLLGTPLLLAGTWRRLTPRARWVIAALYSSGALALLINHRALLAWLESLWPVIG